MFRIKFILFLAFISLIEVGCGNNNHPHEIHRAFYYWKSAFLQNPQTQLALDTLHIEKLYIRFFDVDLVEGKPMPVAPIDFRNIPDSALEIIPTIFITQACIKGLDEASINLLANQIVGLTEKIASNARIAHIKEIQLDCDWTASSTSSYFALLKAIKTSAKFEGKILSVTIRLYQLKYISKVGIPPADRGMLMCYNMGDLKNPNADNSILSIAILKEYLSSIRTYPLLLDVALPLFKWQVLFRDGKYKGLIREFDREKLKIFADEQKSNNFVVRKDTLLEGYAFFKGDILRYESVTSNNLEEVVGLLTDHLASSPRSVSFFHLDSAILSRYDIQTLDKLYRRF